MRSEAGQRRLRPDPGHRRMHREAREEVAAEHERDAEVLRGAAGQDALLTRDDAKSEEERDVAIPMRLIVEARLVLTDALVTESLRRGKQAERAQMLNDNDPAAGRPDNSPPRNPNASGKNRNRAQQEGE